MKIGKGFIYFCFSLSLEECKFQTLERTIKKYEETTKNIKLENNIYEVSQPSSTSYRKAWYTLDLKSTIDATSIVEATIVIGTGVLKLSAQEKKKKFFTFS